MGFEELASKETTIHYKCFICGQEFEAEKLTLMPGPRCPYCGSKVIVKIRIEGIKRVKAD